jgi:hypothetical protein
MDQQTPEYFEEHTIQIGRVVCAAAYFDDAISTFLAEYLDLSELQENALLRPMSTRAKVDLIASLSKRGLSAKYERQMRPLFKEAKNALDERNALIHGVPAELDGKMAFVSWVGKGKLDPKPEPWPVERVCMLATRFLGLMDAFEELTHHFRELVEGSEDTPDQGD